MTGASGGLGLALVRMLLDQGHKVAATSRDVDALMDAVGAKLEGRFLPLEVNLADEGNVRRAVDTTVAAFGRIDVVVNNAGHGLAGALETLSDAELRDSFDINVFGVLNVVRAVMPRLRAQRGGHVFNISSILGFDGGSAGWGAYSAAKFAVSGLSETLALEAAPHGVRVSLVYPGAMRARAEGAHPEAGAGLGHPRRRPVQGGARLDPGGAGAVRPAASVPGARRLRPGARQDPVGAAGAGALARDVRVDRLRRRTAPGRLTPGQGAYPARPCATW